MRPHRRFAVVLLLLAAAVLAAPAPGHADVTLVQISSDPFTNPDGQHRTEAGSDVAQNGTSIFTAFRAGLSFDGTAAGVGYAAYHLQYGTVTNGFLDGITVHRGGVYRAVEDVGVAYSLHGYNISLIISLATGGPDGSDAILVSRSIDDGRTYFSPVTAATGQLAKSWFVCDNTNSQFTGVCYLGYTVTNAGNALRMRVSADGGFTWGPERATADNAAGFAGRPSVRTDGTVVVPYLASNGELRSFRSVDGGQSWQASVRVSDVQRHTPAGGLADRTVPSLDHDYYGRAYVAWSDCRFRTGCTANDIVVSTSADGTSWTPPAQVPIDPTTSTVDHFLPGIGVDHGSYYPDSTRIGLTFYYYPSAGCTFSTCELHAGFVSSTNGGASWSAPTHLAGPMRLSWLPDTSRGRLIGDISTRITTSGAFPVLPIASAPTDAMFNQAMFQPAGGLPVTGGADVPLPPTAPSDLNAIAMSSSQITVFWADKSGNETGFRVERCQGAGCTSFVQVAVVSAGTITYIDENLQRNTSYTYRVRAFNANGNSPYSNTATATTLTRQP